MINVTNPQAIEAFWATGILVEVVGSIENVEQTVDWLASNINVPTLLRKIQQAKTSRVTNTTVVVKDQDYIMLGGLMSDQNDVIESKVPLLGDLPLLGWLFKNRQTETKKKNLIILMRPRIINTTRQSAELIHEKLADRDDFIDRFTDHGDISPEKIRKIKSNLMD